jgi:uncharacterized RDD family membrane protein YckC
MEQFTTSAETNSYLSSVTDQFISEDASTGQRFANYLIDIIAMYIFAYGTAFIFGVFMYAAGRIDDSGKPGSGFTAIIVLIMTCFTVFYYTFSEGVSNGRSLGKLITGTKAVKLDDTDITWKDAFVRSLCRLVPFETFSALGGYPWHDRWTNTKVIKVRK